MTSSGFGQHSTRTVAFPMSYSMGELQVRDWGITGGWQYLGNASGRVEVPLGKELRLKVGVEAANDLSPLAALELDDIQWLDLSGTGVEDWSLVHLANLTLLRRLDLRKTAIGDAGLACLKPLTSLKELRLNHTKVTDAGLAHLSEMAKLENLWLFDTAVTDAGMAVLRKMGSLEVLQLPAGVSAAALADLKRHLPATYINTQK